MPGEIAIRPYHPEDRAAVRTIACDTALMGKPCEIFFNGRDIMADALTAYYTDFEPRSCFVAEADGRVVGYLTGSVDVARARNIFSQKVAGYIVGRAVAGGVLLKKKNLQFLGHILWSMMRGEFRDPRFAGEYPAELHINVADGFRDRGIGGKLVAIYLDYLRSVKSKGLHFGSFSDEASVFFQKQGFRLLHQGKRSYFRHVLGRDVNLYIFGKKL